MTTTFTTVDDARAYIRARIEAGGATADGYNLEGVLAATVDYQAGDGYVLTADEADFRGIVAEEAYLPTNLEVEAGIETVVDRKTTGLHIVRLNDKRYVSVELTRRARHYCATCDQPLGHLAPGPLVWVDPADGGDQGSYSHQHGCGWDNPPVWVRQVMPATAAHLEHGVLELVTRLDAAVTTEQDAIKNDIRERLLEEIAETRAALDDASTPAEWNEALYGTDEYPGPRILDGTLTGKITTWGWDWTETEDTGTIVVVEE